MSDLLNLHLFQPTQWREAESSPPLLWDRTLSNSAIKICHPESLCPTIVKFLTESESIKLIFILSVAFLVFKQSAHLKLNTRKILLGSVAILFAVGDLIANQLKYVFYRLRPDNELYFMHTTFKPSFSLPSNHAYNLCAIAACLWLLRKNGYIRGVKFPTVITVIAVGVSISRVFVGRHFPLDVVAGLILGVAYAWIAVTLIKKFLPANSDTPKH